MMMVIVIIIIIRIICGAFWWCLINNPWQILNNVVLSPFICGAFSKAAVVLEVLSQLGVVLFNGVVQT